MRRMLTYIIIVLLLSACTGTSMRKELYRVDSLNRAGISLDTINMMQDVVDYYNIWGNANERMLSHYLLGCVFRDQNNSPMALRCYRDAVSYADTLADDCDYYRLSRIYGQMAELFHHQRSPRLELVAERQAVHYAWKAKDTLSAIIFYSYLSAPYHMLNEMDSVLDVIKKSEIWYNKIGRNDLAASFQSIAVDIYLQRNDYVEAKRAMDKYEQFSGFFNSRGEIDPSNLLYFKYKGTYYEHKGLLDSAEYYYRKLLSHQPDYNRKEAAYRGLLSLYNRLNQSDSIAKYSFLYCQTNDSASFAHSADEIVRAQALYSYEEQQRIAEKKSQEASYYRNTIVVSAVILVLLAFALYRYIRTQQRRKRAELMAANAEYASLLQQYDHLQHDLGLLQHDMSQYRQEKEQEHQVLLQKLAFFQDVPQLLDHWDIEKAMLDSLIVSELHQLASQAKQPSGKQWKELREFMEHELPDFFSKIDSKEVCLSPQEVLTSILIRLQFSQGELSALFGVSKQRVNNIKRSINQKLFAEEGAATLNQNIINL